MYLKSVFAICLRMNSHMRKCYDIQELWSCLRKKHEQVNWKCSIYSPGHFCLNAAYKRHITIYVGVKMQPKWAEDNGIVKKQQLVSTFCVPHFKNFTRGSPVGDIDSQEPKTAPLLHLGSTDVDRCEYFPFFSLKTVILVLLTLSSRWFSVHHSARQFLPTRMCVRLPMLVSSAYFTTESCWGLRVQTWV